MPSRKDRLYVALYVRGGQPSMPTLEDTYHWALIVGPKEESSTSRGRRFHATQGIPRDGTMGWRFETTEIKLLATQMLLVRICVGKIEKKNRVEEILRSTPIRGTEHGWNCVHWVMEALKLLQEDGKAMGTSALDWADVRNAAMTYVQKKKDEHRFDGEGSFDMSKAPTYDLLDRMETIS